jgi:hypothetical protein
MRLRNSILCYCILASKWENIVHMMHMRTTQIPLVWMMHYTENHIICNIKTLANALPAHNNRTLCWKIWIDQQRHSVKWMHNRVLFASLSFVTMHVDFALNRAQTILHGALNTHLFNKLRECSERARCYLEARFASAAVCRGAQLYIESAWAACINCIEGAFCRVQIARSSHIVTLSQHAAFAHARTWQQKSRRVRGAGQNTLTQMGLRYSGTCSAHNICMVREVALNGVQAVLLYYWRNADGVDAQMLLGKALSLLSKLRRRSPLLQPKCAFKQTSAPG